MRALAFLTVLLGFTGCFTNSAPPAILIGHVSDKSRLDQAGDQAELGMRLALHELTKDDALVEAFAGRPLQVRHTNTRGQLDAFESQAVRLDSVNRCVALFGGLSGPETVALANAKIPVLTFHGQPASGAGNHVFYFGMQPVRQGAVLAQHVADDAKANRVAIVVDEKRPEAIALVEAFQKALADARPAALLVLRFNSETTTKSAEDARWSDLLERMLAHDTHTVVFAGAASDFNAWHKVMRKKLGDGLPRVVFAGPDGSQRSFDLGGEKSEVILASAYYADPANEKITAFARAFREANKTDPDVNAALAYDGMRILVAALKAASIQLTAEKLREKLLETKDFPGLTGPLTITSERQVTRPLFVLRWQNGAVTALKTP